MGAGAIDVRVFLFGRYRELAGTGAVSLSLPEGSRVGDLVGVLRGHPSLEDLPADAAIAVNRTVSNPDRPLSPGDEIAVIPPVAGG